MVLRKVFFQTYRSISPLPYNACNKILFTKQFVTYFFEIFNFVIVNRYKYGTIVRKKVKRNLNSWINHI